jgi:hypothetical protein
VSNPNVRPPEAPRQPAVAPPTAPVKYVPPKEPPVLRGFVIGPGPEGKANTYTLWLVTTKADKVLSKDLLEVCHFGLQEVLDAVTNWAFDLFFLKLDIVGKANAP